MVENRAAGFARIAVPAALAGLAALHAGWAAGLRWPGGSDRALAEHVLGASERKLLADVTGSELPPAPLTAAVALVLLGAAATVATAAGGNASASVRRGTWGVAGTLLARAAAGVAGDVRGGPADRYERLDLALYSPLCAALGTGAALVARAAG